jgi:hypothetical protein
MLFSETGIGHLFCSIMHFSMKVLPRELFVSLHADKAQDIGAALVQWALGSSVFAIVSAMITLAVTYPLFLQIVKERTKKNL